MYAATGIRPRTGPPSTRVGTMTPATCCSHGRRDGSSSRASSYTQLYPSGGIDGRL